MLILVLSLFSTYFTPPMLLTKSNVILQDGFLKESLKADTPAVDLPQAIDSNGKVIPYSFKPSIHIAAYFAENTNNLFSTQLAYDKQLKEFYYFERKGSRQLIPSILNRFNQVIRPGYLLDKGVKTELKNSESRSRFVAAYWADPVESFNAERYAYNEDAQLVYPS
eukprot:NODE_858_length_3488_cov_0.650634.p3 type:complete len:166 gc:universal NODE_858_length_3488_cov_0.650634:839-342(-)